jgi:predicted GIY-YIG superfamily endonuclease
MKLFLNDIKNYAYKSIFDDCIKAKTIYKDQIIILDEVSEKSYIKQSWYLSRFSDNACVYFLLDKEEVVYIGQTRSSNRIKQHKKDKIFSEVWFVPVKFPYNIIFEINLLSKYKTKYNKRYSRLTQQNNITSKIQRPKNMVTQEEIDNIYLSL